MGGKAKNESAVETKYIKFAQEFYKHFDGAKAARAVGFKKGNGLSKTVARLLANATVQAELRKLTESRRKKTEISVDKIEQELAAMAFSNLTDVAEWSDGGVTAKDSTELDENVKAAVQAVEFVPGQFGDRVKVAMHDKKGALELLGKQRGMFRGTEELPERVILILKE